MDENEWGEGFPTITSLFIPISLPRKLYGASAQNRSNSVSAEILSIPHFITLYIYPGLDPTSVRGKNNFHDLILLHI